MKSHLLMQDPVCPDGIITMLFEEYDVMPHLKAQQSWLYFAIVPYEIRWYGCQTLNGFVQLTVIIRGLSF